MSFEVMIDGKDRLTVDDSVNNTLGGGGQGNVYVVTYQGKKYALKWYTNRVIIENPDFKRNLKNNSMRTSPDKCILWPQHFAENDQSYGFLMEIIDTNRYTSLSNFYNGKKRVRDPITGKKKTVDISFKSDEIRINAAINLAASYKSLDGAGMVFPTANDGSFYFDADTGDLVVCECDEILTPCIIERFPILGTLGFIAPELVEEPGSYIQNVYTSRFSLSVLLYMLLVWSKPFNGKKMTNVFIYSENEKEFYGRKAVFVHHPTDDSNRPIPEDLNNQIFWSLLTPEVQNLFIRCFTEGMTDPSKRPTADDWVQALKSMKAELLKGDM